MKRIWKKAGWVPDETRKVTLEQFCNEAGYCIQKALKETVYASKAMCKDESLEKAHHKREVIVTVEVRDA